MSLDTATRRAAVNPDELPGWVHPSSAGRARHHRRLLAAIVRDGVLAGVLGAALIAGFFALMSLFAGRSPLHVAALLGSALFPQATWAPAGSALAYTAVHTAVLVAIGIMISGLARVAAGTLQGWYVAVLGLLFLAGHIVALPIWFGDAVAAQLPLWLVNVVTGLGMLGMCAYLWWRNPGIAAVMHEPDEP
jgi:hypothetical protein